MQLTDMGDHAGGPAAAGVAAEPALQAGLDGAERDAFAVTKVAAGACLTDRIDTASDAAEHGLDHDTTGTEIADR